MEKLSLATIAEFSKGMLIGSSGLARSVMAQNVSIDSRTVQPGDLFIAIRGERFDGHDFIKKALEMGAVGVMVQRDVGNLVSVPIVRVEDTVVGLQNLAKSYRESLSLRTVAVAGSNGKTGTKELVAGVLSQKFKVLRNEGNLNNHVGVPFSLLKLDRSHELVVFEVGTNHPGELDPLLKMVRPVAGVVTVIGEEHMEFFKTLEGVACEEGTVAEAVGHGGFLALNADDVWSEGLALRTSAKVGWFGFSERAIYRGKVLSQRADGTEFEWKRPQDGGRVRLELLGRHQVSNALAAIAVGDYFGLEREQIQKGLESVRPFKMRLEPKQMVCGVTVLNDAYNANPSSMRAALSTMRELQVMGRRIAVIGEMRELGESASSAHREIGVTAMEQGVDLLIVVGSAAKEVVMGAQSSGMDACKIFHFENHSEATAFLKSETRDGDVVLVKGSRGAMMEKVLEGWV